MVEVADFRIADVLIRSPVSDRTVLPIERLPNLDPLRAHTKERPFTVPCILDPRFSIYNQ